MNINIINPASTFALLCGMLCSVNAHAETWEITDFRFGMNDPSFGSWLTPGGVQSTDPSTYGSIIEGTYQGTNTDDTLVNFQFFGTTTTPYTALNNQGVPLNPAGTIAGGPVPTFNLTTLEADLSSWIVNWNGNEFNQGNGSSNTACITDEWGTRKFFADFLETPESQIAKITDHNNGSISISWASCITGGSFNGLVGFWKLELTCTSCPAVILDPEDSLTVTQATYTVLTVGKSDGPVLISSAKTTNLANTTYTWVASDASITDSDSDEGTFTFDPTSVPVGFYTISHTYSDTSSFPTHNGTGSVQIKVVADSLTNHFDDDGDGIPNASESGLLTTAQLQSTYADQATYIIETNAGSIKVGNISFCGSTGARVTLANIIAYGAGDCKAATNATDDLIKAVGVGGFYDFEISGLAAAGDAATIVIPLSTAIPAHATYRKYNPTDGWTNFAVGNGDSYASAPSISAGVCPTADSTAYQTGLNKGDTCLRLTITDGGLNDADKVANGSIKDPGGIAEHQSGVEAELASGCSISGKTTSLNNHSEWLLLFVALAWLGLSTRTRKQ